MKKEIVIKFDYAKNGFMVSVVSGNLPANSEQRPSVYQHELDYEESAMGQAIGDMALRIIPFQCAIRKDEEDLSELGDKIKYAKIILSPIPF